jgi:hypothetical protein
MASRVIFFSVFFLLNFITGQALMAQTDEALKARADKLAQKIIITDTHVDYPYRLYAEKFQQDEAHAQIPVSSEKGNFDYEREERGLDAHGWQHLSFVLSAD